MFKLRREMWMIVVALALLVAFFAPATPADGQRLVVRVNEPFEVNGDEFPAGKLSLREVRALSPVATINEIRVDGVSLGLLVAHDSADDATAMRDELIFKRASRGHLVLDAVAVKGQPIRTLYEYRDGVNGGQWHAPSDQPIVVASTQ